MFSKIFLFEINYKLRRPAVYIYFLLGFVFTALSFAKGAMPLDEDQLINGASALALFTAIMSLMAMVVSSSVMGLPLIRDIEYNTKEYYLSYPITKAGYFWGRFLSSFFFVLVISSSVQFGAYMGTFLGPVFGWSPASHYGANVFWYYFQPFITIAIPNLFFSSALFFGLVSATKNVKVIYTSGALLFLGYLFANFLIHAAGSMKAIYLCDPFMVDALRYERSLQTLTQKNTMVTQFRGLLLWNRVIWTSVALFILLYTYIRFSFEKFFAAKANKKKIAPEQVKYLLPAFTTSYKKGYNRKTLATLTRIEILNVARDAYFWIIIIAGGIFMAMVFSHLWGRYGVPDFPLTKMILQAFTSTFPLFIFCIIAFYAGETVHRERITRYSAINDALAPPTYIFHISKFTGLLSIALLMAVTPMVIGIAVQLANGYTQLSIPLYLQVIFLIILPNCIQMVMFAFAAQVLINNKFAALGVAIALWVLFTLADQSGWMNYHLFLYGFTPNYGISTMDGIGHMQAAINWFNVYWVLFGCLLLVAGYLLYVRGHFFTVSERLKIAGERFKGKTKILAAALTIAFIATACYNYYNVNYVNSYYTQAEYYERAALTEKQLKHYDELPLPTLTRLQLNIDLFPQQQKMITKGQACITNKNNVAVTELLLDGDNIDSYDLVDNNKVLAYTNPLIFKPGKYNFLKPAADSSSYRLYVLPKPILPGDSLVLQITSQKQYKGFQNGLYGTDLLHNGTTAGMGLPNLGYDDDEEISGRDDRIKYGLPPKEDEFSDEENANGVNRPVTGMQTGFMKFDIVISTTGGQTVVGPGNLVKQWQNDGRNYFEYTSNARGIYSGIGFASAQYAHANDSIRTASGKNVGVDIYYQPSSAANVKRFIEGYKAGLKYYTAAWGPYNFNAVTLAESPVYSRDINMMAAADMFSENFGWNANFSQPWQWDYCYFTATRQLAKQWWQTVIIPSHTKGAGGMASCISKYAALLMLEKKYGLHNINNIIANELDDYLWMRGRTVHNQQPVINSNRGIEFDNKGGVLLYGLKNFIGEDSINAALRDFYNAYSFKTTPPYARSADLYECLKRHVPDSLQYYLSDSWNKITFYDNKIVSANVVPLGGNKYKVQLKISVAKTYEDEDGNASPAAMNDYIEIGVFGSNDANRPGYPYTNTLYANKYKLTQGEHSFDIIVTGKPISAGIDPFINLIDKNRGDNWKAF